MPPGRSTTRVATNRSGARRRWPPILLAWVLIVELITAAAVPLRAEQAARHAQVVTPARAPASPVTREFRVGDRQVRLVGSTVPAVARMMSQIEADIGGAVDAVQAFWGTDWTREISIVVAGTDEEFRVAAGGGPASRWADIAAVTVANRVDPARRLAAGEQIVFAPGAAGMRAGSLRIVLTHELFHYAARADTALNAPRWLTEGVADFVARPPAPVPVDALPVPLALPSDADLDTPQRSSAYDRAWWFARFVADTYGAAKLRDLYAATCGATPVDVPVALHDVLGDDVAVVLVRWHQWASH
ncbi:hypothetical protein MCNS_31590 [Mycobacterium conspicuum]|uniref:DUF4157 domain-containing protein n=1 Tax=Mycobacterium conspicuum TaxID=44010 RepID=A0A7I7YEF5_9MYCO|nr:hypothetical protein MCNS_31590 [Mycobacterium conspicuum]